MLDTAKCHKVCYACLGVNHRAKDCRRRQQCPEDGCYRRHHRLLHAALSTEGYEVRSTCNASTSDSHAILGYVPVRLTGPTGELEVYALIDNGSDTTLVSKEVVSKIGSKIKPCRISISTLHGIKSYTSGSTSLQISSLSQGDVLDLENAYVVERMPVAYAEEIPLDEIGKWPHLVGINPITLRDKKVGIILGCDMPEVHEILDQRVGVVKQPYAVKSVLGWTIRGPCGVKGTNLKCVNVLGTQESSLVDELAKF